MIKTKIATIGLSLALVLGVSAPAGAVTVAELQAQINALMAQLATLQGGTTTTGTYNFTQNLTVGSTGGDVTSLQMFLVGQGHLNMPQGVSYGYFGTLTRAAVAAWQAANGITPAVGYFGPISRAKANTQSSGTTTGGTTTGGTTTGGTTTGGITTPGVEGTITARLASTPTSITLREGDVKKAVMGIELEAKTSDIRVERIKLNLGASTEFYRKIASRLYVMDGSTVLATVDLNADTVVKDGSNYFITVSGFNFIVPKDTKKNLQIALDAYGTIDSAVITSSATQTITVPVDGVRGTDGAGINQFSPITGSTFSRTFTIAAEDASNATLKVSLNVDSPRATEVVAAEAISGSTKADKDKVELLKFDVKAEKSSVKIEDLKVTLARAGGAAGATTTTAYLMNGSTVLASVNASNLTETGGTVTFENFDYVVAQDATKTLTVAVDIRGANSTSATYSATVNAAVDGNIVAMNSLGDTLALARKTGSATGETITIRNVGVEITLSSKSLVRDAGTIGLANGTSTASATYSLSIKAVGGDIWFGTQAASSTFGFGIHAGGANAAVLLAASTTGYTIPSGVVTSGLATDQAFKLADGQTVSVPVTFFFEGRLASGALVPTNSYAVSLSSVVWSDSQLGAAKTSTFMLNKPEWRTNAVTMP